MGTSRWPVLSTGQTQPESTKLTYGTSYFWAFALRMHESSTSNQDVEQVKGL